MNEKKTIPKAIIDTIRQPRKLVGLALAGTTLSLLTACGPSDDKAGEPINPLPTPSQIDQPTTSSATTQPSSTEAPASTGCDNTTTDGKRVLECLGYSNINPGNDTVQFGTGSYQGTCETGILEKLWIEPRTGATDPVEWSFLANYPDGASDNISGEHTRARTYDDLAASRYCGVETR